ncbi:unnamed protein product [Pleuronectes platessa]|uniref:Uncharacterized protein n=1 Tax=Pleuronectes platessa TaxID=8262 RepID=A0A9N7YDF0_PLEPL|nr:unnamed protein product [Pleuronectes platessa]
MHAHTYKWTQTLRAHSAFPCYISEEKPPSRHRTSSSPRQLTQAGIGLDERPRPTQTWGGGGVDVRTEHRQNQFLSSPPNRPTDSALISQLLPISSARPTPGSWGASQESLRNKRLESFDSIKRQGRETGFLSELRLNGRDRKRFPLTRGAVPALDMSPALFCNRGRLRQVWGGGESRRVYNTGCQSARYLGSSSVLTILFSPVPFALLILETDDRGGIRSTDIKGEVRDRQRVVRRSTCVTDEPAPPGPDKNHEKQMENTANPDPNQFPPNASVSSRHRCRCTLLICIWASSGSGERTCLPWEAASQVGLVLNIGNS